MRIARCTWAAAFTHPCTMQPISNVSNTIFADLCFCCCFVGARSEILPIMRFLPSGPRHLAARQLWSSLRKVELQEGLERSEIIPYAVRDENGNWTEEYEREVLIWSTWRRYECDTT